MNFLFLKLKPQNWAEKKNKEIPAGQGNYVGSNKFLFYGRTRESIASIRGRISGGLREFA